MGFISKGNGGECGKIGLLVGLQIGNVDRPHPQKGIPSSSWNCCYHIHVHHNVLDAIVGEMLAMKTNNLWKPTIPVINLQSYCNNNIHIVGPLILAIKWYWHFQKFAKQIFADKSRYTVLDGEEWIKLTDWIIQCVVM